VGEGPFPTELHGEAGDALRKAGGEFGATTGRPRRCGWLDLPALRMGVRFSGMTGLALTKLDVLAGMPSVKVCVAYNLDGKELDEPPIDPDDVRARQAGVLGDARMGQAPHDTHDRRPAGGGARVRADDREARRCAVLFGVGRAGPCGDD
jgi:adenylosuccinate synthase